jgi:DNA-binding transcriptional MerR regulator
MEYQIGEFSLATRLSVKTLRFYHEEGLLEPSSVDPDTGYRTYNDECLRRAATIRRLRELDFGLKEIREILADCRDDRDLARHLAAKAEEVRGKIRSYRRIERRLAELLAEGPTEHPSAVCREIRERSLEDQLIAGLRFTGRYEQIGESLGRLFRSCGRLAAGKPFTRRVVNGPRVASRILAGGRALCLLHQGPYERIGEAYRRLYEEAGRAGIRLQVPGREVYLRGPGLILAGNPARYLTEVQLLRS